MITLRPYQQAAVSALYDYLRARDDNPCLVLPTGAGKTFVIAQICRDAVVEWSSRVLVLAHVKELLQQSYDSLKELCPDVRVGLYSAGLKRRDTDHPVIVAGIQSVWRRAADIGPVDVCLVDEAHLIPAEDDGMYREFLAAMLKLNPQMRIVGLTATPYRLKSGMICEPENMLNAVCYEISIRDLIAQGYLCPLVSRRGDAEASLSGVHIKGGEFVGYELENACLDVVESACREVAIATQDRKAVLVFTSGIKHGEQVTAQLRSLGCDAELITGDTSPGDRERLVREFRTGTLKYLVNVNVLTTGFDARNVDCVVLLRPTMSPGLYYQMCGRGFRTHKDKKNCLVLDFGGNIRRHGPVDQIEAERPVSRGANPDAPMKTCPQCEAEVMAGNRLCGHCGFMFPDPEKQTHEQEPEKEIGILSTEVILKEHEVQDVYYRAHTKKGADPDHPRTLMVEYQVGLKDWISEWVCVEHDGFAGTKARKWWRERSREPMPSDAGEAARLCAAGRIKTTEKITTRVVAGEKWPRIVGYVLGPMPEADDAVAQDDGESQQFITMRGPCAKCGSYAGKVYLCGVHHTVRCVGCHAYQYHAKHCETVGIRINSEELDESEVTEEEAQAFSSYSGDYDEADVPF